MKKTKEQKIIDQMLQCLWDVSDIQMEHIDDTNYREFYEEAADALDMYDGAEADADRLTYENLDEYVSLRNELVELLKAKGMSKEERLTFIRQETAWEE